MVVTVRGSGHPRGMSSVTRMQELQAKQLRENSIASSSANSIASSSANSLSKKRTVRPLIHMVVTREHNIHSVLHVPSVLPQSSCEQNGKSRVYASKTVRAEFMRANGKSRAYAGKR
jgi:hypothetical protein